MPLNRNRWLILMLLCLITPFAGCTNQTDKTYAAEINAWHEARIKRLNSETGWLTLIGLFELKEGISTIGSAEINTFQLKERAPGFIGSFNLRSGKISFSAATGVNIFTGAENNLARVDSIQILTDASESPTVLIHESLRWFVIERSGVFFVRVKDTESEVRRDFSGIERFPTNTKWRIQALLIPNETQRTVAIPNALGQVTESSTPGRLVFEVDGEEHSLIPIGRANEALFIVFGDTSNGLSTYSGGRFLATEAPDEGGFVFLDFNKATNPPCVFTPFATCPLPPPQNRLSIAVPAGEKMWEAHH